MTEVRLRCPGGDDQAVVLVGADRAVGSVCGDGPGGQVEALDRGHLDGDVRVPPQDVPQRWRDLALGQDSGRQLVEQRLEEVVVPGVDERHLHGRPAQELRSEQPAEAASDDDNLVNR